MRRAAALQASDPAAANDAWAAVDRTIMDRSPWLAYAQSPARVLRVGAGRERPDQPPVAAAARSALGQLIDPPDTGGSSATSSPSAIGVERAARSPFTTNDDTAATAAKRSPNRSGQRVDHVADGLAGCFGLGGVGRLAQRGEQPHSDHDSSNVSWIDARQAASERRRQAVLGVAEPVAQQQPLRLARGRVQPARVIGREQVVVVPVHDHDGRRRDLADRRPPVTPARPNPRGAARPRRGGPPDRRANRCARRAGGARCGRRRLASPSTRATRSRPRRRPRPGSRRGAAPRCRPATCRP